MTFTRPLGSAFVCLFALMAACSSTRSADEPAGASSSPLSDLPDGARVRNPRELARMDAYLAARNDPRVIVDTIRVGPDEDVDCIDVHLQHGADAPIDAFADPPVRVERPVEAWRDGERRGRQAYGSLTRTCPPGTIPRLHLTRDTLVRFETLDQFFRKYPQPEWPRGPEGAKDLHQHAAFHQLETPNVGSQAVLNLWSPYTELPSEFSLSQLWVVGAPGSSDLETVETGWQVFRDYYGSEKARLFAYFTPNNYVSGGCYNLDCNKFVQVDGGVLLGGSFAVYSVIDGEQYALRYELRQNDAGDWWLGFNDVWVGYWPNGLFEARGLANGATEIAYGGEVMDNRASGRHTKTDMGSGRFPSAGWMKAAYQRNMTYFDGPRTAPTARDAAPDAYAIEGPNCYDARHDFDADVTGWRRFMYFGGRGLDPILCW